ncbi:MAG: undecaprenyl-phosphate glucose phosphotransferase [Rikenellaceae bacterium]
MTNVEGYNRIISTFVVCIDIIIINLLFVVFQYFWGEHYYSMLQPGTLMMMLTTLTVSYIVSAFFSGVILYYRRVRPDQIVRKTVGNMIVFMLIWLLLVTVLKLKVGYNRPYIIFFAVATTATIIFRLSCNAILKSNRSMGRNRCNAIYVGSGSNLMELYNEMALHLTTGYDVIGYFDAEPSEKFEGKCEYLGKSEEVIEYLSRNSVDRVYCGLSSRHSDVIVPIMNYCEGHLIRFFSVPNFRNYCQRRLTLEMFSNVPLLSMREEPLSLVYNRIAKRVFDIVVSLCFLIPFFLPIYIIVGIITKITSPGPIFFKQKRHGLDGKEFSMYKFRSMKVNSESDTLQATIDDPRKTKFGNFLRKTSIDELPQFLNVLKGDMSIVGPRPHMLKHTEEYSQLIKTYMVRHLIKPGVTGWAQVTGFRGETKELCEMEGRVKADIWYIEHWTFFLDLYIMYKTVANVVGRKDDKAF